MLTGVGWSAVMSPEPVQLSHIPRCPFGRTGRGHVFQDFLYFINSFWYHRWAFFQGFCLLLPAPSHLGQIFQLFVVVRDIFHACVEHI